MKGCLHLKLLTTLLAIKNFRTCMLLKTPLQVQCFQSVRATCAGYMYSLNSLNLSGDNSLTLHSARRDILN